MMKAVPGGLARLSIMEPRRWPVLNEVAAKVRCTGCSEPAVEEAEAETEPR